LPGHRGYPGCCGGGGAVIGQGYCDEGGEGKIAFGAAYHIFVVDESDGLPGAVGQLAGDDPLGGIGEDGFVDCLDVACAAEGAQDKGG